MQHSGLGMILRFDSAFADFFAMLWYLPNFFAVLQCSEIPCEPKCLLDLLHTFTVILLLITCSKIDFVWFSVIHLLQ